MQKGEISHAKHGTNAAEAMDATSTSGQSLSVMPSSSISRLRCTRQRHALAKSVCEIKARPSACIGEMQSLGLLIVCGNISAGEFVLRMRCGDGRTDVHYE